VAAVTSSPRIDLLAPAIKDTRFEEPAGATALPDHVARGR
jgi:hypothetical protein